ncbi:MAG TPA: DUF6194 family protein [Pseudonocardia sp.]|nr:DUF6194 family protein [Pseudonocardia sp.]
MDDIAVIGYITGAFDRVAIVESSGDTFFFFEPGDRTMPFATLVTSEEISALDGDGDYRLNVGLTKATYSALFGAPPRERDEHGVLDTGVDPTTRDRLMPNPYYASHHWVSVVNPSAATFESVRPLLAEAYDFAVRKAERRAARTASRDASAC